jgi:hypothetical protein
LAAHFTEITTLDQSGINRSLGSWNMCKEFIAMKRISEECMFIWVMKEQIQMDMDKVRDKS